jgi:outer membrane receptor protein involved in Fe transport
VDDNSIPAIAYLDFRASYRWSDHILIYGAMDNVTDADPPATPTTGGGNGTNQAVYDTLGRAVRFGIRVTD